MGKLRGMCKTISVEYQSFLAHYTFNISKFCKGSESFMEMFSFVIGALVCWYRGKSSQQEDVLSRTLI
jgi:hypothetical protein